MCVCVCVCVVCYSQADCRLPHRVDPEELLILR